MLYTFFKLQGSFENFFAFFPFFFDFDLILSKVDAMNWELIFEAIIALGVIGGFILVIFRFAVRPIKTDNKIELIQKDIEGINKNLSNHITELKEGQKELKENQKELEAVNKKLNNHIIELKENQKDMQRDIKELLKK